ncbi:MAG: tail fiber protein, partial [Alloprevotella sp.]|nr:tail fiber protein [Alloprevotella sp.]
GDVAFSASLPSYLVLKCTTAGTTAATEPDFSGAQVGGTVTDGTVVWQYYDLLSGSGVPLGSIIPYAANADTPPYGLLFCEGQAVSRAMYPDLFALIGTTYGEGDGSTTFNLPNMIGKYPQGDTTAGTVKSAGLPNIEGEINPIFGAYVTLENGSLKWVGGDNSRSLPTGTGAANNSKLTFDASKSNPIYGASDTVTPPTLTVRWIIKSYDAPTPSSAQIDLSQYAAELARRLTREQTPAFNKRDVITTSGTYTAPVTGWYRITVKGGGGGGQGSGFGNSYAYGGQGGGEGGTTIAYEKMTAGQTAAVVIGAGGAGGAAISTPGWGSLGASGGNSSVTVNTSTYIGGGGGSPYGGNGTIIGARGDMASSAYNTYSYGGTGGGGISDTANNGLHGCGGSGGTARYNGSPADAGHKGGDGFVWFEYFDGSLN